MAWYSLQQLTHVPPSDPTTATLVTLPGGVFRVLSEWIDPSDSLSISASCADAVKLKLFNVHSLTIPPGANCSSERGRQLVERLPSLRSISVSGDHMLFTIVVLKAAVRTCTSLRSLSLLHVDPIVANVLAEGLVSNIVHLSLSVTQGNIDDICRVIAAAEKNTHLQLISSSHAPLPTVACLLDASSFRSLVSLDLSNTYISFRAQLDVLDWLERLSWDNYALRNLGLGGEMDRDTFSRVVGLPLFRVLKSLTLSAVQHVQVLVHEIQTDLPHLWHMEALSVKDGVWENQNDIDTILSRCNRLKCLTLTHGGQVQNRPYLVVSNPHLVSGLEELSLFMDVGRPNCHFVGLCLPQLRVLKLGNITISTSVTLLLTTVTSIYCPNLVHLGLYNVHLTNDCILLLADALEQFKFPLLQELRLSGTNVSPDTAEVLRRTVADKTRGCRLRLALWG